MYLRHEHKDRLVPVLIEKFVLGPVYRPLLQIDLTGVQEQEASRLLLDRLRGHTGRGRHHPFPGVLGQGDSQADVGGRFPGAAGVAGAGAEPELHRPGSDARGATRPA